MALSIEARLGRGRTVETLAAQRDGRAVVVKRPRPDLARNPVFAQAFAAWAESLVGVEHENLAAILAVERQPEGTCAVQERVEGASLAAVLKAMKKRKRSFLAPLALAVMRPLSRALVFLHARDITHGGLDPGEVLIGYDGSVKLADPRLHSLDEKAGADLEDPAAAAIYRAPELGPGAASPAGDVYAGALVLLEMLLGQPLWTKEKMTVEAAITALRDFTGVGQAQPELAGRLAQVLVGATKAGDGRISAEVLAAAFDHVINEQGVIIDPAALGACVKAAVPPPESAEAPTMMLDPEQAERIAQAHAARGAQLDGASAGVDPELERKVLTMMGRPAEAPPPVAPVLLATGPAEPVPEATAILAPSVRREARAPSPEVSEVGKKAQANYQGDSTRAGLYLIGGGLLLLLLFAVWLALR